MFTACSHALLTSVINRRKQPGMRHRPEPVRPARHRVNVAGLRDLMTFHRWHSSLSSITDHNLITRCTMWELISLTSPGHGHMRYRRMNHAYSSYEPQPSKILAFVQFYRHKLYWYRPINSRERHVHLLKRKVRGKQNSFCDTVHRWVIVASLFSLSTRTAVASHQGPINHCIPWEGKASRQGARLTAKFFPTLFWFWTFERDN